MYHLWLKVKESLSAVLPISAMVLLLHFTIAPLPDAALVLFLLGTVFLIVGMGFFTLGADMAMMSMGERIGAHLTKSRKLWLIIVVGLMIGVIITVAEPDLQVLAKQVPAVPDAALIASVAIGVGIFLVVALLRIIFQVRLSYLLIGLYIAVFGIGVFTSPDFLAVAFDSGGVTTGPITVPFILALGIGVAAVRGGKSSHDDSFGLVALCSVGPILAVMLMGLFFDASSGSYYNVASVEGQELGNVFQLFVDAFPEYLKEVGLALAPILAFFIVFQIVWLKLPKSQLIKYGVGIVYTFLGLVLFLIGVNVGFMPVGNYLGNQIAGLSYRWILIPLGMVMGFFVVAAEPAVHVLNNQVEEISGGTISKRAMMLTLSIGVAISIGLAMIRVLTGISIWYFLLPGYLIALILTFFVPKIFTAVAFDSGGVASGPMTATFLLPFAMGACEAVGGNMMTDAFGIVAMVAMTPLITIQLLGLVYRVKSKMDVSENEEEEIDIIDL